MKKILISLTFVVFVLVGCSKAPLTDRNQFIIMSPSQELSMGLQASKEVIEQNKDKIDTDKALLKRVQNMGGYISKEADFYVKEARLPDFEWEFHIIEEDLINAFCLPGGKVFVYTGLMKAAKNDAQLATVVAHEIAHAIARHGAERMSTQTLVNIGGMIVVGVAAGSDGIDSKTMAGISVAYGIGSGLGQLKHSRTQESEADYVGLMIMAKAGYDPRQALAFWENMKKENEKRPIEFLSTHPLPETRIKDIKNLMPEATEYYEKSQKR